MFARPQLFPPYLVYNHAVDVKQLVVVYGVLTVIIVVGWFMARICSVSQTDPADGGSKMPSIVQDGRTGVH